MLDRKGLSEERIAEVHAENLAAMKVVATATKDGQITDVLERPDYATRQRHPIRVSTRVFRDPIFTNFFRKIAA